MRWLLDRAGKLILAAVCCLGGWGGVLGAGLRFKVTAPNVDTSGICCLFILLQQQAK